MLMAAKVIHLDEDDRKLILETRQKLEEITKLMEELLETFEILSDPDMMEAIREGLEDLKVGRVTELRKLLKEETR
jgi:PHD/YefM family antitoxin component YafN of YafNO toxin-antitoxin module